MKSMKLDAAESKEEASVGGDADRPEYPYGLTVCLDNEALAKLGMKDLPDVGEVFVLEARVVVCSKSQYERQSGSDNNMSLQITDMALAESDDEPKDRRSAAEKIYGKK